nr:hypothetical protein [Tanacetum cinerariifolium]
MVTDAVKKEIESSQLVVSAQISQELAAYASKIIEEIFRIYMKNMVIYVNLTTSASTNIITSDLQQLYLKMKSDLQAQVVDLEFF